MSETLTQSAELQPATRVLPQGEELGKAYREQFAAMALPSTARWAEAGETPNVMIPVLSAVEQTTFDPQAEIDKLQREWTKTSTMRAKRNTWWHHIPSDLAQNGADGNKVKHLAIAAKHNLQVEYDGKPTEQGYEIFEMGDAPADPAATETVAETLQLVDQLSGGMLAADGKRPRVLLLNDTLLQNKREDGQDQITMGLAMPDTVYISLPGVAAIAEKYGTPANELLAAVTVHEVLGHSLEHAVEGRTGEYFKKHFHYSEETVAGDHYARVHAEITPKDSAAAGSQPSTEYGRSNASEDFATSTESVVSEAMGWNPDNQNPAISSTPDAHRKDLVMSLMDQAARRVGGHAANPGLVGSEVRYTTNAQGEVTGVQPARSLEITTISGEEAVSQELQKVAARYPAPQEFIVKTAIPEA